MDTTRKKTIVISLGIILSLLTFYFAHRGLKAVSYSATTTRLTLNVSSDCDCTKDKFNFSFADRSNLMMEISAGISHHCHTDFRDVVFKIPLNFQPAQIRISLGSCYSLIKIKSLTLAKGDSNVVWDAQTIFQNFRANDPNALFELKDGIVYFQPKDQYPAIVSKENVDVLPIIYYENTLRPLWYALMLSILVFAIWHFLFLARFNNRPQDTAPVATNKEQRLHQLSLGIAFIVLLLLPLLVFKGIEDPKAIKAENRNRAGFPKIRIATILNYTPGLNDFLNDNFGGRSFIIQGHALLHVKLFNVSPIRSRVEIGKNDRLFYVGDDVKELSQNRYPLTETQLKKMRKTVVENYEWLKLKGIKFYLVFPLIPQSVYGEDLPQNLRKFNEISKLRQFITYLRQTTDLNIIDVEEPLRNAKKYLPLYLKQDTHWNRTGGYVAYLEMYKSISRDFDIGKPLTSKNFKLDKVDNGIGDLEAMMGIPYIKKNMEIKFAPSMQSIEYVDSSEQVRIFAMDKDALYWMSFKHTQNTRLPKVLLYRDSYSGGFLHLFLNHFSHSTLVWSKKLNPEEVNYAKPDMVVFEMLERFITLFEKENLPAIGKELKANGIVVDDAYFKQHPPQRTSSSSVPLTVN